MASAPATDDSDDMPTQVAPPPDPHESGTVRRARRVQARAWYARGTPVAGSARVMKYLAGGATGQVYAVSTPHGLRALKVVDHQKPTLDLEAAFAQEVWAYRKLESPFVPKLHATGKMPDGRNYLITDVGAGGTLRRLLRRGWLPIRTVFDVAAQLFRGLRDLHGAGVVHADIKPSNLLFVRPCETRLWLIDFGICRRTEPNECEPRKFFGTPAFTPPEQFVAGYANELSDIYSACLVLYVCLTGMRPFIGTTAVSVLKSVLRDSPPPIRTLRPDCPPELAALVEHGMRPEPGARFNSAESALRALEYATAAVRERRPSSNA